MTRRKVKPKKMSIKEHQKKTESPCRNLRCSKPNESQNEETVEKSERQKESNLAKKYNLRNCRVILQSISPEDIEKEKFIETKDANEDNPYDFIDDVESENHDEAAKELTEFFKQKAKEKKIYLNKMKSKLAAEKVRDNTTRKVPIKRKAAAAKLPIDDKLTTKKSNLIRVDRENAAETSKQEEIKPANTKTKLDISIQNIKTRIATRNAGKKNNNNDDSNAPQIVTTNGETSISDNENSNENQSIRNQTEKVTEQRKDRTRILQENPKFQSTPKQNAMKSKNQSQIFNNLSPLANITNISQKDIVLRRLNQSENSIKDSRLTSGVPVVELPLFKKVLHSQAHENDRSSRDKENDDRLLRLPSLSPERDISVFMPGESVEASCSSFPAPPRLSSLEHSGFIQAPRDSINHASIFRNQSAENQLKYRKNESTLNSTKKTRSYERTPTKNITTEDSNPTRDTNISIVLNLNLSNQRPNASIVLPEKRNRVENPSRISPTWSPPAAATVDARLENCFGFDDVDENGNQKTPSPKHTTIEHHLPEIRKNLKRFLHRPVIEKPSKKRKRSPRKNIAQPSTSKSFFDELQAKANKSDSDSSDEIRIEQPMKQRDIRAAFNPCNYVDYTDKRKKDEPNIFGETETERTQDRRRSYSRPNRERKKRRMVAFFNIVDSESEHESEAEEAPVEEPQSKRTKKANERKKLNESQDLEELDRFANEFNSMCDDIDNYELIIN